MATTYDLIASQTLGSAASSITFSSIAASWTDLRLVTVLRGATGTGTSFELDVVFNSDTGTNYSYTQLTGNGTAASSFSGTSSTYAYCGAIIGPTATAGIIGINTLDIFSYAGSTYKTLLYSSSTDQNGGVNAFVARGVSLWRSTSAITSITLTTNTSFATGGTANLYGIKAA